MESDARTRAHSKAARKQKTLSSDFARSALECDASSHRFHRGMKTNSSKKMDEVQIQAGHAVLSGSLMLPENTKALVLFVHGSGSSRHSPRNQFVARVLNGASLGTLLFDLLTPEEEALDIYSREHRFNIGLLAERLMHTTKWARQQEKTRDLHIGYFGSSTGGAAALVAAAELTQDVGAVVSRGGRPDLAGAALPRVQAPTLLIVGGNDDIVIELNEMARDQMRCEVKLEIIPGATHLFEEPGALEQVAKLASDWFLLYLSGNHE
jgi:putative phosphoribosyl transferase